MAAFSAFKLLLRSQNCKQVNQTCDALKWTETAYTLTIPFRHLLTAPLPPFPPLLMPRSALQRRQHSARHPLLLHGASRVLIRQEPAHSGV